MTARPVETYLIAVGHVCHKVAHLESWITLGIEGVKLIEEYITSCEEIFTPPTPERGDLGRFVANIVFHSKQSLPYQREVWRDCLYGRGLFRETHKKKDSFMLSFVR